MLGVLHKCLSENSVIWYHTARLCNRYLMVLSLSVRHVVYRLLHIALLKQSK